MGGPLGEAPDRARRQAMHGHKKEAMNTSIIQAVELQNAGRIAEAEPRFRAILAADPNQPIALYSLAVILMQAPRSPGGNTTVQALALVDRGVAAAPHFAPLWLVRAMLLQAIGRKEEALQSYDEAVRVKPDCTEALINSGALLRDMHRHVEAIERFNQVLTIDPNHESALGNCGILLTEFKRSDKAIAMFERLLAINPDYAYGLGLLIYERLHACDWTDLATTSQRITEGLRAGKRVCKTLALMAISGSASDHFLAARIFSRQYCPKQPVSLWQGERYAHDRIRIAYVSPDLREHPVGHLMAGVFERHDKSRFETIAISLGVDDSSRLRARMRNAFDHFIDVRGQDSLQIARLMREMEVDIAIDLAGYTSDSRTDVFAYRPAPVQVGYLGYPGTMGSDYFDFILGDHTVIPPEHEPFYSEEVVRLPDTYLPTDAGITISDHTPTRAECGLPETGSVLCSFSHDYKIHPDMFEVWMRILRKTPGSVLWLVSRNEFTQANLRRAAEQAGVDAGRLVFAGRVPRVEDHLARYRLADVFLDTAPYNAHTTAADALMAGLPVVTWLGNAFPSRVAASLLRAIGMPELVTNSLDDYEALVLKLLHDAALLADTKARLAANRHTHALFDTARFSRNLEAAYLHLMQRVQPTPGSQPAQPAQVLPPARDPRPTPAAPRTQATPEKVTL